MGWSGGLHWPPFHPFGAVARALEHPDQLQRDKVERVRRTKRRWVGVEEVGGQGEHFFTPIELHTTRPPLYLPHQLLSHECRVQWIVGRALGHVRQEADVRQGAQQQQQPVHQHTQQPVHEPVPAWLERYEEMTLWAASYRNRFVASTAQQVLGCVVTIVGGGDVRMVSRLLALIAALYARLLIPAFIHSRIYVRLPRALSLSFSEASLTQASLSHCLSASSLVMEGS